MRTLFLFVLLSTAVPAAADFDAFAYRRSSGPVAVAAEIQALKASLGKHRPDPDRSERLMRLTLALSARCPAAYRASLERVIAERRRISQEERQILEGPLTTEWLNSRWMNSMSSAGDPFARELFRRTFADQHHAETPLEGAEAEALRYLLAVDEAELIRANAQWLEQAIAANGWFDISRYGAEASQAAWLLVQHADYDPGWQRSVLALLEPKTRTGDFQPKYYAYLDDRVAVNSGRPQRFGTQGRCVGKDDWQPLAVADPAKLDERRASVGLEPMAEYRARFTCRG
ncbi:MAG TPA: DUF6624 domain-containing protein [Allosphingosinicella sp.]|jgi:hypothetical protein